jgi:acyl-CoA hydrolase
MGKYNFANVSSLSVGERDKKELDMTCNVKCRNSDPMGTLFGGVGDVVDVVVVVASAASSNIVNKRCTACKVCTGMISNISCRKG